MNRPNAKPRVVIVGGGFGGLYAAKGLGKAPVEVLLIDRRNYHLFQPLLYQVATGALSPANIAVPLRAVLERQANTRVLLDEATGVDLERRAVKLGEREVAYDYLVVATGASHHYFGHDEWAELAPGLKTVEDGLEVRRRILLAFEEAEKSEDAAVRRRLMTFVVVGGGPTGVELAGAIAEIARHTLRGEYRAIDPAESRIILIEALDRVLPAYERRLSEKATASLVKLGVEVRTSTVVDAIEAGRVTVRSHRGLEVIEAETALWAAGVRASGLSGALAQAAGIEQDRQGRVTVGPDLSLAGHPEVFVVGDLAHVEESGTLLPAVAPVAIQEGGYVAKAIQAKLAGESQPPFRYRDIGSMATIGRSAAVADLGWLKLWGFPGWLAWLFIHILQLAGFENRLLVMTQWAWNYLTRGRSARLITGEPPYRRQG
jgi:NADH dehydrogenase